MNHETVQDLLSSYLDGDLSAEERAEVEAHLEGCDACREEYELLKLTVEALHDLPDLAAPQGFAAGVLDQIPDGAPEAAEERDEVVVPLRRKGPTAMVWAPIAVAAAAGVVVAIVWTQLPRLTGKPTADQLMPTMVAEEAAREQAPPASAAGGGRWSGDERAKSAAKPMEDPNVALDGLVDTAEGELADEEEAFADGDGADLKDGTPRQEQRELERAEDTGVLAALEPAPDAAPPATGNTGAYYSDWERQGGATEAPGDAVADMELDGRGDDGFAPAPPAEVALGGAASGEVIGGGDHGGFASGTGSTSARGSADKADEYGFDTSTSRYAEVDEDRTTLDREKERMAKEDEAYRAIYDAEDDAVVDTLAVVSEESEEEDGWDEDAVLMEAPEATSMPDYADDEVVASKTGPTRGGQTDGETRDSRADRRDRDSSRGKSKDSDRGGWWRPNKKAEERKREASRSEAEALEDASDVAAAAPAATQAAEPKGEVAAGGSAEWTLQTTDAGAAYAVAELCDEVFSLRCTWGAPNNRAQSLDPQANYQVVELHVLGAEYASVQTRLRGIGSVLVRSEDIARAEASDPVTVRLIIEYMP